MVLTDKSFDILRDNKNEKNNNKSKPRKELLI